MKDSGDAIFGAWLGEGLRVSKGSYYGSGESWVLVLAYFSVYRKTYLSVWFLGSCGDTMGSWMYTTGLGRTTMSRYVNLSTFRLAAGAYIFYFYFIYCV